MQERNQTVERERDYYKQLLSISPNFVQQTQTQPSLHTSGNHLVPSVPDTSDEVTSASFVFPQKRAQSTPHLVDDLFPPTILTRKFSHKDLSIDEPNPFHLPTHDPKLNNTLHDISSQLGTQTFSGPLRPLTLFTTPSHQEPHTPPSASEKELYARMIDIHRTLSSQIQQLNLDIQKKNEEIRRLMQKDAANTLNLQNELKINKELRDELSAVSSTHPSLSQQRLWTDMNLIDALQDEVEDHHLSNERLARLLHSEQSKTSKLETEIRQLRQEAVLLQTELEHEKTTRIQLQETVSQDNTARMTSTDRQEYLSLILQLKEKTEECQALSKKSHTLQSQLSALEEQMSASEALHKEQEASHQKTIDTLTTQIDETKEKQVQLSSELSTVIKSHQDELRSLNEQLESAKNDRQQISQHSDLLQKALNEAQLQLEEEKRAAEMFKTEKADLQSSLTEEQHSKEAITLRKAQLESDLLLSREQEQALRSDVEPLVTKASTLQSENDTLRAASADIQEQLKNLKTQLQDERIQHGRTLHRLRTLETTHQNIQSEAPLSTAKEITVSADSQQKSERELVLEESNEQLRATVQQLSRQLEDEKRNRLAQQTELHRMAQAIQDTKSSLASNQLAEESLRSHHEEELAEKNRTIETLNRQLNTQENLCVSLQNQLDKSNPLTSPPDEAPHSLTVPSQVETERIQQLEHDIQELTSHLETLTKVNKDLTNDLEETKKLNKILSGRLKRTSTTISLSGVKPVKQ